MSGAGAFSEVMDIEFLSGADFEPFEEDITNVPIEES